MQKISCIICAYNEGERMTGVLSAVTNHPLISEVIVVNDGSIDNTADVAKRYREVRLITLEKNSGKSAAMAIGIAASEYDLLAFFDADLVGITPKDVTTLIQPVLSGVADMTISLRRNSLSVHRLIGLDFTSGERVVPKSLFADHAHSIPRLPRFGIEVYMNELIIRKKFRIGVVYWENVLGLRKSKKMGTFKGIYEDTRMAVDILRLFSVFKIVRQNYQLLHLVINPEKKIIPLFKRKLALYPPIRGEKKNGDAE